MKTKISKTIGGLRIAMQALAERRGVVLTIGGSEAGTDGREITIPSLPEDNEEAMVLARGYIDHEAAHIALTNFGISARENQWVNLLEDVRIERKQGEKYPGVAINTAKLLEAVVKQGGFPITKQPIQTLQVWTASRARTRILRQQALAEREVVTETMCRALFGDPFCDEFAAIVDTVKDCQTTLDCRDLGDKLDQLLKSPPAPPPPPKEPEAKKEEKSKSNEGKDEDGDARGDEPSQSKSNEDEDEDGDTGGGEPSKSKPDKGENENGDTGSDELSQSKSNEGEDEDGDTGGGEPSNSKPNKGENEDGDAGGDEPSKSKPDKVGGSGDGAGKDPLTQRQLKNLKDLANAPDHTEDVTDLGAMLKNALEEKNVKEIAGKGLNEEVCVPKSTIKDTRISPFHEVAFEAFKALLAKESLKTAKMKTQLAGLFQAIGLKQNYPAMVGSRIDSRSVHLVGAQTPDNRVFLNRRKREMVNTAIALMIDKSGSMKGEDMTLAIQSAYITSRSLESLPGITHCIGLYPGEDIYAGSDVMLAKGFEERCRPEQFWDIIGFGGTPMAEAALWAGMMLSHRPETRKISILFTDGQPDNDWHAKKAVDKLRRHGIEVYVVLLSKLPNPLAITCDWIDNESVTVITMIEQLPKALHALLKDALLKKRMVA